MEQSIVNNIWCYYKYVAYLRQNLLSCIVEQSDWQRADRVMGPWMLSGDSARLDLVSLRPWQCPRPSFIPLQLNKWLSWKDVLRMAVMITRTPSRWRYQLCLPAASAPNLSILATLRLRATSGFWAPWKVQRTPALFLSRIPKALARRLKWIKWFQKL